MYSSFPLFVAESHLCSHLYLIKEAFLDVYISTHTGNPQALSLNKNVLGLVEQNWNSSKDLS